jgi:hypothetical protein
VFQHLQRTRLPSIGIEERIVPLAGRLRRRRAFSEGAALELAVRLIRRSSPKIAPSIEGKRPQATFLDSLCKGI